MILHICYNDDCLNFLVDIQAICAFHALDGGSDIDIKDYNESHYKEKKKAYRIKGGYSARKTPFMLLTTDGGEFIKAFYSEDDGCTSDKFKNFITKYESKSC